MQLRRHTHDDLPSIGALYRDAVHTLAVEQYDEAQRLAWAPLEVDVERWDKRLQGLEVLVADLDGRVMGFVAWKADGYIDLLYTHPAVARTGVATRLMDAAESDVMGRGVTLATVSASDVSRPLFERRGYRVVGEDLIEVRGQVLRSTRMEKDLPAGA